MRDASSASRPPVRRPPVFDVPLGHRLKMVALGYIPFLHLAAVVATLALPLLGYFPRPWAWLALAVLYLAPPLASRAASLFVPLPEGRFDVGSREFLRWWFHAQWQVIFNRFPFLEEGLRMVPALYSLWLRLWGSRVGALVYWTAGVTVLDRPCLQIGDRVVFGAGVVMTPHTLMPDASRRLMLSIGPIVVGSDSLVGGGAVLAPGVKIGPGELVPAFSRLQPFSEWQSGRRVRDGGSDETTAAALATPSHERIAG